ncbi:MAG: arylsulfatase [Verrucomicrobiota bacterium]
MKNVLRGIATGLAAMLPAFLPLVSPATAAMPGTKPNILLILADDMGYSDAGCYGGEIETPNLNRLAENGVRFTQFYNTARCWPSRASILTGYYAQQVRRDTVPGIQSGNNGMRPAWAQLLPAYLKPLGYRAYHSGKWHVDGQRLPAGFDRSYSIEDHNRYFYPREHFEDDVKLPAVEPGSGYYATTYIASHAIKCLKEHAEKYPARPFFHYLAFISPHFPLHALPEDIAKYRDRYLDGWDVAREHRYQRQRDMGFSNGALSPRMPQSYPNWNLAEEGLKKQIGEGEAGRAVAWTELSAEQKRFQATKMAIHAAMVDRMDREIGRVLEQLKAMGAYENTLILFLSDNGASAEQIIRGDGHDQTADPGSGKTFLCLGPGWSTAANTPLRLHKSWVHEGGISTPLIVQWLGGIKARGELRNNPGHLIDLVPTLLDVVGGAQPPAQPGEARPPLPGKSLVPVFTKDQTVSHDYFWWFHSDNRAIRMGDWKVVADGTNAWELYDLSKDRSECNNLAAQHPDKVTAMTAEWQKHMDEFKAQAISDGKAVDRPMAGKKKGKKKAAE